VFGKTFTLGRLFDIPVRLDASWAIIAVLITWSLAAGFFPAFYPGLASSTYLAMAVVGALGLFLSILFHEFAHALVARRFGVRVSSVTLFVFGGVGEMRDEPPSPRAEFWIAIAGPASSTVLAVFFALTLMAGAGAWMPVFAVLHWLLLINMMLALFNMVPAFPLDGGRVFRALLWHWTKSLQKATRASSGMGKLFGYVLMFTGALQFIGGNVVGGIWLFLIGRWVKQAALLMRRFLEGEPVSAFMKRDVVTASPELTLDELVEGFVYPHHHKMFPVVEDGEVLGCITLKRVAEVPRPQWPNTAVRDRLVPCSESNCIDPDADIVTALDSMHKSKESRMLVVRGGRLQGVLTLKDVLGFLALKMELEAS
jgi:Zn-dependent protease